MEAILESSMCEKTRSSITLHCVAARWQTMLIYMADRRGELLARANDTTTLVVHFDSVEALAALDNEVEMLNAGASGYAAACMRQARHNQYYRREAVAPSAALAVVANFPSLGAATILGQTPKYVGKLL